LKTLIVIGGPTASGKTSLAIQLAQHYNTSILSADSRQWYREMTIGVAKPTQDELNTVPHYFINSHSIHDKVSAGEFERFGLNCLNSIFEKNKIAVCVGGTGLYIKAICEGIDEMPIIDKKIETQLNDEYAIKGLEWLQQELKSMDSSYYESIDQQNPMRLLRALIFIKSTGKSISSFQQKEKKHRPFNVLYFSLDLDRSCLYNRINQRVDLMISHGLLDEVKNLISFQELKCMHTVGYSELFQYLNQECTLEYAIDKIKQHSRNYAKRQVTWFKNQSNFTFLEPETAFNEIVKICDSTQL
jgi:tRNA dimethylallyltransferase